MIGGEPLAEKQMIQAMLADSVTELWAARLITYEAARGARPRRGSEIAACALLGRQAVCLGGGQPDRGPRPADLRRPRLHARERAERFFRELRVDRIWEGTSEIQRLIIARALLKRGLEGM